MLVVRQPTDSTMAVNGYNGYFLTLIYFIVAIGHKHIASTYFEIEQNSAPVQTEFERLLFALLPVNQRVFG